MRNVKVLLVIGLVLGITSICWVAWADYDKTEDWKNNKRDLKYSFEVPKELTLPGVKDLEALTAQWQTWVNNAANKWHSADTGWKLTEGRAGDKEGQIYVMLGTFEKEDGKTWGQFFREGETCEVESDKGKITVRLYTKGYIVFEKEPNIWSETVNTKLHPERVAMHEFGHALRLDHTLDEGDIMCKSCAKGTQETVCGAHSKVLRNPALSNNDTTYAKQAAQTKIPSCPKDSPSFGPLMKFPYDEGPLSVGVPSLTEWGLIALGLLLAGSLAWMIRRRFSARPAGA